MEEIDAERQKRIDRLTAAPTPEVQQVTTTAHEDVKEKLLKVDSCIHFQTEPSSSTIYGSGYFNIETTDLSGGRARSRAKESDVIIYKVLTTGPTMFCVKPTIGILKSHQYVCVNVRANPRGGESGSGGTETMENLDKFKFQVQAMIIPPNHEFLKPKIKDSGGVGDEREGEGETKLSIDQSAEEINKLYTLWTELVQANGPSSLERHKITIQVHPVETSLNLLRSITRSQNQHALQSYRQNAFQYLGILISMLLFIWLAIRLVPPSWLKEDVEETVSAAQSELKNLNTPSLPSPNQG